ncbi:hypothetical protein Vretimale_7624, partial [Volvox reticuliferus]
LTLAGIPTSVAADGETDGASGPQQEEPLPLIRKHVLQASTITATAACEVPKATVGDISSGIAPPVTHKTPPAPNIPLSVTLVQLRPQQPVMVTTSSGCDSSSSVSMVPPAAAAPPPPPSLGELLTG